MHEEQHTYQHRDTVLHYLLYLPTGNSGGIGAGSTAGRDADRPADTPFPFILFLHGIGERGDSLPDLNRLKIYGIPHLANKQPDFPFIVAAPQCPSEIYWHSLVDDLHRLVLEVTDRYPVDLERIYLTGLSMGGYGAWHLALRYPNEFAAVAPVCGGYIHGSNQLPPDICTLKGVPIWAFHGAKDPVVLPQQSIVLVDALKECGGEVRFTLYPDAEHDSWTPTYNNPELYQWFLSHRRRPVK